MNLELASEYLLMATWLTYLKSKLLLPESEEEEFKALEVAERLDYIGVEYNLSKLNRYVKEQKHKGCHKYQMSKVQEEENDSGI